MSVCTDEKPTRVFLPDLLNINKYPQYNKQQTVTGHGHRRGCAWGRTAGKQLSQGRLLHLGDSCPWLSQMQEGRRTLMPERQRPARHGTAAPQRSRQRVHAVAGKPPTAVAASALGLCEDLKEPQPLGTRGQGHCTELTRTSAAESPLLVSRSPPKWMPVKHCRCTHSTSTQPQNTLGKHRHSLHRRPQSWAAFQSRWLISGDRARLCRGQLS